MCLIDLGSSGLRSSGKMILFGLVCTCLCVEVCFRYLQTPPVYDRLQYANTEGEGLGDLVTCGYTLGS